MIDRIKIAAVWLAAVACMASCVELPDRIQRDTRPIFDQPWDDSVPYVDPIDPDPAPPVPAPVDSIKVEVWGQIVAGMTRAELLDLMVQPPAYSSATSLDWNVDKDGMLRQLSVRIHEGRVFGKPFLWGPK